MAPEDPIVILIPVFNDWKAAELLLQALDEVLANEYSSPAEGEGGVPVQVLLVDDASTEPPPASYLRGKKQAAQSGQVRQREQHGDSSTRVAVAAPADPSPFLAISKVQILELRRNLGHQRAIAIGLAYVHANEPCQAVLIMDGDGEDDPRDVPRLIERYRQEQGRRIIFARRCQRSESLQFRLGYVFYKLMHRLLTGREISVGNFSILPFEAVDRLVAVNELWNHYASAVFKARLAHDSIPTNRAPRLAGQPRMNFVSLIIHGLSSIAAYGDIVGVRLLLASFAVICVVLVGMAVVVGIKVGLAPEGVFAIPGWATNAFGLLLIVLVQAFFGSVMFIYITLNSRQGAHFLPVRDYSYFVLKTRRIV